MTNPAPLQWHGDQDGLLGWPACPECLHYMHTPGLIEACGTREMLREVTGQFHASGHKERASAAAGDA